MILYHGSNMAVPAPRLLAPTRTLDFGPGFYTTLNREQAVEFSSKVVDRMRSGAATLNVYDFDRERAFAECSVLEFAGPDGDWLDFVSANRRGDAAPHGRDIVFGPVANDNVYRTLGLYMSGVLDRDQTLAALKIRPLFNQVCLRDGQGVVVPPFFEGGGRRMNEEQFSAFLGAVVPGVVALVAGHYGIGEAEAADRFYSSRLYADLSDEHLKIWHYGPQTLFDLFRQEVETDRIEYPEEAC